MGQIMSVLVCRVTATAYPGYMSYKAVTTKNVEEYMRWMKYWTVFAAYTAVEFVTDIFASWLPLYYEVKILFVLYLMMPQTKGSDTVFTHYLQPLLKEHEGKIDDGISELSAKIKSQAAGVTSQIAERARRATADSLLTVSSALITGEDPTDVSAKETEEKVKKSS